MKVLWRESWSKKKSFDSLDMDCFLEDCTGQFLFNTLMLALKMTECNTNLYTWTAEPEELQMNDWWFSFQLSLLALSEIVFYLNFSWFGPFKILSELQKNVEFHLRICPLICMFANRIDNFFYPTCKL
jgi:hypothetical protein